MEVKFPLILDGATGTQLQKRGFDSSICAEDWTLQHPEVITEIQESYIENGSQIVYAPTFGANRVKLESHGIFNQVSEYNHKLAAISKQAVGKRAWVAGDIAPTGKFLYPLGDVSFDELVDIYTEQALALEEAGVDLFVIETMMTLAEARAAVLAVKSVSTKPVFVTVTCDENGKMLTGTDVTAALVVLQGMGIDAFGLNCSTGPEQMLIQLQRLKEYAAIPLIAKPNAGTPQVVDGKTVYDCPPAQFAALVPELIKAGVCIFGGCCGTQKEHISALSQALAHVTPVVPTPSHPTLLPCATEKLPFLLETNVSYQTVLPCDDDLEDALFDLEDDTSPLVAIELRSWDELDTFSDCQGMIPKPLCLVCNDPEILEQALRRYQGRALYEGTLPDSILLPLSKKYGLIL